MTRKADGAGGKLKLGLAAGAAAVGSAMVGAGVALVDFAKQAGEDAAQAQTLADTLKPSPASRGHDDTNAEWIDSMEIATNVADTELREAVSKLTLATGDLTEAQDLTTPRG